MLPVTVTRTDACFVPDPRRVIAKRFVLGENLSPDGRSHTQRVVSRVLAMPEPEVASTLRATQSRFRARHKDLTTILEENCAAMSGYVDGIDRLSVQRRLLLGAYFTHEYSVEAAALTNPSMVPAPDQSSLTPGARRFLVSLRAIGEGHISSIQFRSGVIDAQGNVEMEAVSPYATTARRHSPLYEKALFRAKLK